MYYNTSVYEALFHFLNQITAIVLHCYVVFEYAYMKFLAYSRAVKKILLGI